MDPVAQPAEAQPASPLPRSKRALFTALAIALPLVTVLLIEGALRLAGVGEERRRPFVPIPEHEDFVALSPEFGASFFRGFTPGVAFDPIRRHPSADDLRVIALGGSSTAGFPYSFYYGFPARLEDRLSAMLPGRPVEVANLGMTATNSYTLLALTPPVIARAPDAVVIYAGHNEYYGAFGTGGTEGWTGTSIPLKRFGIAASRWALVSGLSGLVRGDRSPPTQSRTLMARVVREASIERDGDLYRAGVRQYEANLRDALRQFEAAGVPVFLATLTSNLADQPPLGDERAAAEAFARGRSLLASGDTTASREAFLLAKELDGLRFRAPEAMGDAIRRLADEFANVTLVDVAAQFREASPGGLEGASLFTDHLHPNARGYALMADAFAASMRATLPALRGAEDPGPASWDIDPVEAGLSDLQLTILTSGYPFDKSRTPAEAEAVARSRASAMIAEGGASALAARIVAEGLPPDEALGRAAREATAAGDTLDALRLYDGLLHWRPFNRALAERAVALALADPAYDGPSSELARFASTHAAPVFGLNALAAIALRNGNLARAEALLDAAERADPQSSEMLFNRARLLVVQGDTASARTYFERYQATQR